MGGTVYSHCPVNNIETLKSLAYLGRRNPSVLWCPLIQHHCLMLVVCWRRAWWWVTCEGKTLECSVKPSLYLWAQLFTMTSIMMWCRGHWSQTAVVSWVAGARRWTQPIVCTVLTRWTWLALQNRSCPCWIMSHILHYELLFVQLLYSE